MEPSKTTSKTKNKVTVALDLRVVCLVLIVALLACVALWRPWTAVSNANDRTIEVTGEATLEATPDEYVFSPNYQFNTDTKEAALSAVTQKSSEVIAGLKQLGLQDSMIKSDSSGYENQSFPQFGGSKVTYNLQLTINVDKQALVQAVQDYLITTVPTGSVTPNATFSESTRKELERKGRTAATADARKKADQSAEELDFKVQKIKSISDTNQNTPGFYPLSPKVGAEDSVIAQSAPAIAVQPGQNELSYAVTVVYYIK